MVPWPFCEVRWGTWLEKSTLTAQHGEAIGMAASAWLWLLFSRKTICPLTEHWPLTILSVGNDWWTILLLVKGFFKSLSFWLEDIALVSNSESLLIAQHSNSECLSLAGRHFQTTTYVRTWWAYQWSSAKKAMQLNTLGCNRNLLDQ